MGMGMGMGMGMVTAGIREPWPKVWCRLALSSTTVFFHVVQPTNPSQSRGFGPVDHHFLNQAVLHNDELDRGRLRRYRSMQALFG
jgi:hypothetical protein